MHKVMTYKGYAASMTYDPDDKILVGRVLDRADIIGFHGCIRGRVQGRIPRSHRRLHRRLRQAGTVTVTAAVRDGRF